jgi:hypothetical protein
MKAQAAKGVKDQMAKAQAVETKLASERGPMN